MMIGCVSLVFHDDKIVAIECAKGRGIILPGGKWEDGETLEQAAARELLEETGLVAKTQQFVYSGCTSDGFYCHAFLTTITNFAPTNSREGQVVLATWSDLYKSKFRPYYENLSAALGDSR